MGTTQFHSLLSSSTTSQQQIPWSTQFHLLDKQPLNNTYILHHLPTSLSYKIKHMTLNKLQHSQLLRQIDLRYNNPSPFVVRLQKIQQYTVKGYCSEYEQVFLMFKYVETSLKEQILNRRFKRQKFSEEQIKAIMQSGVKGIGYLHEIGCTPKGLNTSQILITKQRAVLVNDPLLSIGSVIINNDNNKKTKGNNKSLSLNSQQQISEQSHIYSIPVEQYPSPQKLLYQNDLIQEYEQFYSQLFTFGIIVLQAIFLQPFNQIFYDKTQKKIYYHKVKQKIQEISSNVQLNQSFNQSSHQLNNKQTYSKSNTFILNQQIHNYNKFNNLAPSNIRLTNNINIINQIKQDLRRLLSHEARIRQSVYLKYKKNHSSYLFLNKSSQQFNINNNINSVNNNNNLYNNNQLFYNKTNNNLYPYNQTNNQINDDINNKNRFSPYNKNNYLSNVQNQNNYYSKLIQQTNSNINHNKIKVISTLPLKNNTDNNLIQNQNNQFITPVRSQYIINNLQNKVNNELNIRNKINSEVDNKQKDNNQVIVHHLGKRSSKQISPQRNKYLGNYQFQNININNLYNQQNRQNNTYNQNNNKNNQNNNIFNQNSNDYNQYNKTKNYSNLNETINQSNLYSQYLFNQPQSYLRKTQLSPKKQTLVQKQPQSNQFSTNYSHLNNNLITTNLNNTHLNNINLTNLTNTKFSTIPSSSYYPSNTYLPNNYQSSYKPSSIFTSKMTQNLNFNNYPSYYSPNINFSKNNITRSQSKYILPKQNTNKQSFIYNQNNKQLWTYDKMTNNNNLSINQSTQIQNKQQTKLNNQFNQNYKISLAQSYSKLPLLDNNKDILNYSSLFPSNYNQNSLTSQQNKDSSNLQNLKSNNNYSYIHQNKSFIPSSITNYYQGLSKIPSSKELSSFPFKQVGSINCDQSHFLNDKQSFVIQSHSAGLNKLQPQRVETPISTLNSSNIPNTSPKNSFEINHSMISNFRNQGKSFSSMDEDLKQLRKFGQQRQFNDKKPNSSYQSSEKVSVIDKIYDPDVANSYDRRSFENSPNKNSQNLTNYNPSNRNSQAINRPSHQYKTCRNSSENYLQTPQRYPAKNRLNSTIRQASCEQSGVNQSNSNNQSYEKEKIYPNTQISKYQAIEDKRLSQRKIQTTVPIIQQHKIQQNNYKTVNNGALNCNRIQKGNQLISQRVTLYADGSRYMGLTDEQGQSNGFGTLYYQDGQIAYQGQWTHGDFNGKGRLFNPYQIQMAQNYNYRDLTKIDQNIKQFDGTFVHDVKQGKGMLKMQNEQVYNGEFANDLPNGRGKFYCSNGNVIEGIWQKGLLKDIL